jgi:hypothetical protein
MTIRFLQTTPSGNPAFPFLAGQVIHVDHPSPELLACLDGVRAEAVKDNEPEYAIAAAPVSLPEEFAAVPVKKRGRPRKAR